MADEQEKRELEKKTEELKKEKPWWQNLSPVVLGGGLILALIILNRMLSDPTNKNKLLFWVIGLVILAYILSQSPKSKEEVIVTPREAELLVERECERKKRWNQFGPMTTYKIGPVSNLQHRDGKGIYYDVAVKVISPYDNPMHYSATVMAKGLERGFVYLNESIGPLSGREKVSEKTLIPEWARRVGPATVLEKIMLK